MILSKETKGQGRIKNWKDAVLLALAVIGFLVILAFVIGLPFIIVLLTSTPFDLYVEAEYVSGILTALSITFGLWAFSSSLFERGSSSTIWALRNIADNITFVIVNLVLFVAGIIFVFLSILSIIPTLIAVCMLISSFIFNCIFLAFSLSDISSSLNEKAEKRFRDWINKAEKETENTKKEESSK